MNSEEPVFHEPERENFSFSSFKNFYVFNNNSFQAKNTSLLWPGIFLISLGMIILFFPRILILGISGVLFFIGFSFVLSALKNKF